MKFHWNTVWSVYPNTSTKVIHANSKIENSLHKIEVKLASMNTMKEGVSVGRCLVSWSVGRSVGNQFLSSVNFTRNKLITHPKASWGSAHHHTTTRAAFSSSSSSFSFWGPIFVIHHCVYLYWSNLFWSLILLRQVLFLFGEKDHRPSQSQIEIQPMDLQRAEWGGRLNAFENYRHWTKRNMILCKKKGYP